MNFLNDKLIGQRPILFNQAKVKFALMNSSLISNERFRWKTQTPPRNRERKCL